MAKKGWKFEKMSCEKVRSLFKGAEEGNWEIEPTGETTATNQVGTGKPVAYVRERDSGTLVVVGEGATIAEVIEIYYRILSRPS